MIFVTGDHHFGHDNIITLCDRRLMGEPMLKHVKVNAGTLLETWEWKPDIDLMDVVLINRWNELVTNQDIVIHVGDFCLGKGHRVRFYTDYLRGRKLFLKGNHDHSKKIFRDAGWEIIERDKDKTATLTMEGATFVVSHRPPTYSAACLRLQALGAGSFWIHGHSHGRAKVGHPRVVDVGVDLHNFYPVPLNLIKGGLHDAHSRYGYTQKDVPWLISLSQDPTVPTDAARSAYSELATTLIGARSNHRN